MDSPRLTLPKFSFDAPLGLKDVLYGLGNVLTIRDKRNTTTTFEYDRVGRVTKPLDPAAIGSFTTHEYDELGNCTAVTDWKLGNRRHTYQEGYMPWVNKGPPSIKEYQAAYDLAPLPELLFNLGQVYRLKGDKQKALDHYGKYLVVAPNGPVAADVEVGFDATGWAVEVVVEGRRLGHGDVEDDHARVDARVFAAVGDESLDRGGVEGHWFLLLSGKGMPPSLGGGEVFG